MHCEIRSYIGTREYQEDSAGKCMTENGLFAVVCDGIGSRSRGGESSAAAVEMFIESFKKIDPDRFPSEMLKEAQRIDESIYSSFGRNSGTTTVMAFVRGTELYWLSVGDSRLYLIRGDRMKQITSDHNYRYILDRQRSSGAISEETYERELARGKELASFIGMGGFDLVDLSLEPLMLKNGDRLLLSTDGLYRSLTEEKIYDIISTEGRADLAADRLMELVHACPPPLDNTTFALVSISETEEV